MASGERVLWPQCNVRELKLWSEVYLGSMEANFSIECGAICYPCQPESSREHDEDQVLWRPQECRRFLPQPV
ncbi:hypothetical protein NQ318_002308 [Aromia moschata]|uniref:Uncharacterized protein n=1 Tax=Aromia moschata TaxID=1265417 RepID=A0AAV8Z5Q2_9CUCU|nr:hypothetical protein NQ318_002308 [Aromia moschata]